MPNATPPPLPAASTESVGKIPAHVAVIMDGNGRWAEQRHLPRAKGHEQGAESVRVAIKTCQKLGIKYLTVYAFSVENWNRPKAEIEALMALLKKFLRNEGNQIPDCLRVQRGKLESPQGGNRSPYGPAQEVPA